MENVLFYFLDIPVYSYGFMIALGLLFGSLLAMREGKRRGFGAQMMFDFIVQVTLVFLISGRFSIALQAHSYGFFLRPWVFFSGLQVDETVGLVAALAYAAYFAFKHTSYPTIFADALAPSFALVLSLGFLGSNVFGRSGQLPWAFDFGEFQLHPVQLYAALGYYAIFTILWRSRKGTRFDGQLALGFLTLHFWLRWILGFWQEMAGDSGNPLFTLFLAIVFSGAWVFTFYNAPLSAYKKRKNSWGSWLAGAVAYLGVSILMVLFFFWRYN